TVSIQAVMATGSKILLTKQQHSDLSSIAQSRALPAGYVFRAKLILMLAEGSSFNAIKQQLQTTAPTIVRWKQRFRQYGLGGLDTYHPGQKPSVLTPALHARILSATRRKPSDGSTHWSCRKLASALGVSKEAVHRVWQEAAPSRTLYGQRRSRVRNQSRRHPRPLSAPTAARGRVLHR